MSIKTLNASIWIVMAFIIPFMQSCKTYAVSFKEYMENEVKYYEISEKSNVLDFSFSQTAKVTAMGLVYNHVYFHLGYAPRKPYTNATATQQEFERIKKKMNSENQATFSTIEQQGDSLLVSDKLYDYIICANHLYDFNNFEKMVSEFYRVLKQNGQLLIVQELVPEGELSKKNLAYIEGSPFPNENILIPYFENNRFTLLSSTKIILNEKMGKVTKEQVYLLKFKKQ
jgi:SAM-dependent methyltransferase